MEGLIDQLSFHAPAIPSSWSFIQAIGAASVAAISVALFCRIYYGGFLVWGFFVGFFGAIFLWLALAVLAIKWGLILIAAFGLPIAVLFYVNEKSPVTARELELGAARRTSEYQQLFEVDPEAAASIAETLNLGLDDPSNDWPEGSVFRGVPKRVVRTSALVLIIGYFVIGSLAYVVSQWSRSPQDSMASEPIWAKDLLVNSVSPMPEFEAACEDHTGIELERCLTIGLRKAELKLAELNYSAAMVAESSAQAIGFPGTVVSTDSWKDAIALSHSKWLEYREASCDMIYLLAQQGSGTGGFIQTCRLRMTIDRIEAIEHYGNGFPDFQ